MTHYNFVDANSIYMDVTRHWHAESEKYAGGDALLTALYDGWMVHEVVFREEFWHAGTRCTTVFLFELELDGARMSMPMVTNPYIERFIAQMNMQVLPIESRVRLAQEQRDSVRKS